MFGCVTIEAIPLVVAWLSDFPRHGAHERLHDARHWLLPSRECISDHDQTGHRALSLG
jgi:hypothetical protein